MFRRFILLTHVQPIYLSQLSISATPFLKCPLLEIDGEVFSQSIAIERFLANKYGMCTPGTWAFLLIMLFFYHDWFNNEAVKVKSYNFDYPSQSYFQTA